MNLWMNPITMINVSRSDSTPVCIYAAREPIIDDIIAPSAIFRISDCRKGREIKSRLNAPNVGKNKLSKWGMCRDTQYMRMIYMQIA
ncbi:hypothetical protein D3C72_2311650 [compost metagenome]